MIAALALAVLAAAPVTPPADAGVPTPETRAKVRQLLGAIHGPATVEAWRALGPGAVPVLEEVAGDRAELPPRRVRAIEALSLLGGPRAEAAAQRRVAAQDDAWDVRTASVRALGRLLAPDRLVGTLEPVLAKDPQPRVRRVAADVLVARAGASGCAAVRAQATREPRPGRGAPFSRALSRCK